MKNLGKNIQKLRKSRGLTQKQLADRLDINDASTISQWERGVNSPYGRHLVKLSKLFRVSSDDLLGISHDKKEAHKYSYFPAAISAGVPIEVEGITQNDVEKISVSDYVLGKWAGHEDVYFTRVSGDSMNKTIEDESLIAVKPVSSIDEVKNGDIVVYSSAHEYGVKYFYNDKRNERYVFRPHSHDRIFADDIYYYNDTKSLKIHGKVIAYIITLE